MEFPVNRLVPKDETLASQFLKQYPNYDGRNVTVAILDTGVDPGAIGLQTTPQGERKIVDIVDATGSGDVDMSKVIKVTNLEEPVEGVSGRKLQLNNSTWKCPSNEFHFGLKAAYELFPKQLVERLKKDHKEQWDISHRRSMQQVQEKLKLWKETKSTKPSAENIQEYENLKAQEKYLNDADKNYTDPGPIYDCVSFYDGEMWRGAIDVLETGNLSKADAMADYAKEFQYATFSEQSQMNYCLKFYDDGNVMSIVCDAGAHGSHVAGIVAAYHPDEPANNGVAPGARIVSIKIGDSRLGSMETGVGLVRGLLYVFENKCDVINMSYGEFAGAHDQGRIVELARQVVDKHGVIFVSSAGNEGPALNTVGAPGGSSSCILGVGAYVSPPMMDTEYTMRQPGPGIAYTWSSRGPTFDGDIGVNICAPGGAITAVPNWTLQRCRLMNGTSMSSPNAAGNIALLISAMKDQGISYTPYSIRRALENTALRVENVEAFAQGRGLIQTTLAHDYLKKFQSLDGTMKDPLWYKVAVPSRDSARGIYLREYNETQQDIDLGVSVEPIFHKDAPQEGKVKFELRFKLQTTAPWISVGENLDMVHGGRSFSVTVHCDRLEDGQSYYGEIVGYDSSCPERLAVFRVPVTVIKPKTAIEPSRSLDLKAGKITRQFYVAPQHSTWMDITITRKDELPSSRLYVVHLLQVVPEAPQSKSSLHKAFRLEAGKQNVFSTSIAAGTTIEICVAQYWNSIGSSSVDVDVQFRGIVPHSRQLTLHDGFVCTRIRSDLATESILPVAKLTNWFQRLRPSESVIQALGERDVWPDERRVFQLLLTYSISKAEEGEIVPRFPLLNDILYESQFEAQLCMIFDEHKKYIGASDAFAEKIKLAKGEYTVKLQVRHDDLGKLQRLKTMTLVLDHTVKEIPLTVHSSRAGPAIGGEASKAMLLKKGVERALFIAEPDNDKLPKGVKAGDLLVGTITYRKKAGTEAGSSTKPKGFEISYNVPPEVKKEKEPEVSEPEDTRPEGEKAEEAIRDLQVTRLKKLTKEEEFNPVFEQLVEKYPSHVPLLQAKLDIVKDPEAIIKAADAVLEKIDQQALILHFGTEIPPDDAAAKKVRQDKTKERDALIDALCKKARALGDLENTVSFFEVYKEIQKWTDLKAEKFIHVALHYHTFKKQYGILLERLSKCLELEKAERQKLMTSEKIHENLRKTLSHLGWAHLVSNEESLALLRYPKSFALF